MSSSTVLSPMQWTVSALVRRVWDQLASCNNISSMSTSVYDTAWVSMIIKKVDGVATWLFPEAFQYLLDNQLPDGSWNNSSTQTDAILHTLAAIMAMQKHHLETECANHSAPADLAVRIAKSIKSLEAMLSSWDVKSSQQVGFEILIPALLAILEKNNVKFSFRGKSSLMAVHQAKMERFTPTIIYSTEETTLIHSLEAFVDKIDFDRARHRVFDGSMMASPASTAAYMMYSTFWDPKAEAYLRNSICNSAGIGSGSVPSAYPSSIFELSWVLSTLLESGVSKDDLGTDTCEKFGSFLKTELERKGGTVGFAPGIMSDADDTARTILTLSLLGQEVDCHAMTKAFESRSWFKTYPGERDPSFSANCNVLNALLHVSDRMAYQSQIIKTLTFICDLWDKGLAQDKWNLSVYYPIMLVSQSLYYLFQLLDGSYSLELPPNIVQTRLPIIVTQIMAKLLREQQSDGSWGTISSHEETSYGLIALKCVSSSHWTPSISSQALESILKATVFLEEISPNWGRAEHLWVEKVSFGSPNLSQAYCIAALKCPGP